MAEPSNIRINPFTGTGGATNYVELTEKHIVPANSPYVIRLNEVPEKQDPSNIKMVYVDSATGAATSTTLTEVAATPGQGEFRPDYSTNTLEDKTWNTGLIEFSAADAGKIIQVTYTGIGTIAAVNSNNWPSWYTDRGDGSDGDFVPDTDTTISGIKNYKSVFIKSGITVTIEKYAFIKCLGMFCNKGILNGYGKGGKGSYKTTKNIDAEPATNGAKGGAGGAGDGPPISKTIGGAAVFQGIVTDSKIVKSISVEVLKGLCFGAGGGKNDKNDAIGGGGGAACVIIANNVLNNKIDCSGENGSNGSSYIYNGKTVYAGGCGGGGGGTVVLIANSIVKGNIIVDGGKGGLPGGGTSEAGANGEDGIIVIKELGVL